MGKLFKLKEWLTVPEAASHLSTMLSEGVSEADVLRLALDGHITLSANFINHAVACIGKIVPESDAPKIEGPFGTEMARGVALTTGKRIVLDAGVVTIRGVFDLPMIGNERLDVEHLYQKLTDGPDITLTGLDGAFVTQEGDRIFQLQEFFEQQPSLQTEQKNYPAGGLPADCVLVVRVGELGRFERYLNDELAPQSSKSAETRKLDSILCVIAALADQAGIAPNERGAAERISEWTAHIGAEVGSQTIKKYLDMIPEAIQRRSK